MKPETARRVSEALDRVLPFYVLVGATCGIVACTVQLVMLLLGA